MIASFSNHFDTPKNQNAHNKNAAYHRAHGSDSDYPNGNNDDGYMIVFIHVRIFLISYLNIRSIQWSVGKQQKNDGKMCLKHRQKTNIWSSFHLIHSFNVFFPSSFCTDATFFCYLTRFDTHMWHWFPLNEWRWNFADNLPFGDRIVLKYFPFYKNMAKMAQITWKAKELLDIYSEWNEGACESLSMFGSFYCLISHWLFGYDPLQKSIKKKGKIYYFYCWWAEGIRKICDGMKKTNSERKEWEKTKLVISCWLKKKNTVIIKSERIQSNGSFFSLSLELLSKLPWIVWMPMGYVSALPFICLHNFSVDLFRLHIYTC